MNSERPEFDTTIQRENSSVVSQVKNAFVKGVRYLRPSHYIEFAIITYVAMSIISREIMFGPIWAGLAIFLYPFVIHAARSSRLYNVLFMHDTLGQSAIYFIRRIMYWKYQAPDEYVAREFTARDGSGRRHTGTMYYEHHKGKRYKADLNLSLLIFFYPIREFFLRLFVEITLFILTPIIAIFALFMIERNGQLETMRRTM